MVTMAKMISTNVAKKASAQKTMGRSNVTNVCRTYVSNMCGYSMGMMGRTSVPMVMRTSMMVAMTAISPVTSFTCTAEITNAICPCLTALLCVIASSVLGSHVS